MYAQYSLVRNKQQIQTLTRTHFFLRFGIFLILEGAFLVFAAYCFLQPLVKIAVTFSKSRALFTAIFIFWNYLAVFSLDKIIRHCLASEWHHLLRASGALVTGKTDRVSVLNSGLVMQISHAVTADASLPFKIAIIAQIIILIIPAVIPATVILTTIPQYEPFTVQAANFTHPFEGGSRGLETIQYRSYLIHRAELRENNLYGYNTTANMIIPWPVYNVSEIDFSIRYRTDIIHYSYSCRWDRPVFEYGNISQSDVVKDSTGRAWDLTAAILFNFTENSSQQRIISQISNDVGSDLETAFLFFGHNESHYLPYPNSDYRWHGLLNLKDIPATYNPSGSPLHYTYANVTIRAPLSSLLICNPQAQIFGGEAVLYPSGHLDVTKTDLPPIGNINSTDSIFMFQYGSRAVFEDTSEIVLDTSDNSTLNYVAAHTFLSDRSLSLKPIQEGTGINLLYLSQIEQNLNDLTASISKAYCFGLSRFANRNSNGYWQLTSTVEATRETRIFAFTAIGVFFWISIGLFLLLSICIGVLGWTVKWDKMEPFGLASIIRVIDKAEQYQHYTIVQSQDHQQALSRQGYFIRLALFTLIEGAFVVFTVCALKLGTLYVHLDIFSIETSRALFTIIFICWNFLSLLLLVGISEHITASEWFYNVEMTGTIITGTTEKVSTLTANIWTHLVYAAGTRASFSFKLVLFAQLAMIAIKTLAPSAISLAMIPIEKTQSMDIGRFSSLRGMDVDSRNISLIKDRSSLISRLELREGGSYGFNMTRGRIVGWPMTPLSTNEVKLRYPTDVLDFEYRCRWEIPEITNHTSTVRAVGREWSVWKGPASYTLPPVIFPLYETNPRGDGVSAYLFLGHNSTHYTPRWLYDYDWYGVLNLEDTPARYQQGGYNTSWNFISSEHFGAIEAPLATTLVCDPQFEVTGGEAILHPDKRLEISSRGQQTVGNIEVKDAAYLLEMGTQTLFEDIDLMDEGEGGVSFASAYMFLTDWSLSSTPFVNGSGIRVAHIDQIEAHLGDIMTSVAKAYCAGFSASPDIGVYLQSTVAVEGIKQILVKGFTANTIFAWISLALFVTIVISISVLHYTAQWDVLQPFGLASALKVMNWMVPETQPMIPGDEDKNKFKEDSRRNSFSLEPMRKKTYDSGY